ncbi:sulfatase [Thalassotalea fonticola]|uniref:Sulfatase n=1 Tax=Thalassotalea fonticola TaxID=3065649 RepID=A0ABZ0GS22_9GAMM|nr:sulfatase [Colwelliaceae bacterium S1-1]
MRKLLVLITLFMAAAPISVFATASVSKQPNIVFILADDHRWDYLSVMGHPFIKTPNIDSIAKDGVLFENAFVTSSLCSPSRASFLTGQYPQQHGVQNNFTVWDNNNVTYFEPLKAAGYNTAFIGKWHMPGVLPTLRGVDQFISFEHMGGQGAYTGTPYIVDGKKLKLDESPVPGVDIKGYITEDLTNFSLKFIENNQHKPFALYLSHKALHLPMEPPKHLAGHYDDEEVKLPKEADSWLAFADGNFKHFLWDPLEEKMKDYAETAVAMDQQIGLVLDKLDQLGLTDNTIVVFAGDNGYMWGEHRLIDKRWSYEESMRIPFIIRYPNGIKNPGRRSQEMLLNLDMAPTFLELAGIEVPEYMQGKSAVSVLDDSDETLRDAWLYKYYEDYPYPVPEQLAYRTKRYKLIEYKRGKKDDLFDLQNDPLEQINLIDEPNMQSIYQQLKAGLTEMEAEVSQPAAATK